MSVFVCQYGFMSQFIEGIEPIYIEYLVHGPVQHKNCDDDATHYFFYLSASKY